MTVQSFHCGTWASGFQRPGQEHPLGDPTSLLRRRQWGSLCQCSNRNLQHPQAQGSMDRSISIKSTKTQFPNMKLWHHSNVNIVLMCAFLIASHANAWLTRHRLTTPNLDIGVLWFHTKKGPQSKIQRETKVAGNKTDRNKPWQIKNKTHIHQVHYVQSTMKLWEQAGARITENSRLTDGKQNENRRTDKEKHRL